MSQNPALVVFVATRPRPRRHQIQGQALTKINVGEVLDSSGDWASALESFEEGNAPIVLARGGYSGVFPESSQFGYLFAATGSLSNVVMHCDLQLTKDGVGICKSGLKLENSTNIAQIYPKQQKTYIKNGQTMRGYFSLDYTSNQLFENVSLVQNVLTRPYMFDDVMSITGLDEVRAMSRRATKCIKKYAGKKVTILYVKGLEPNFTENDLQDRFTEFGIVSSCIVVRDEDGRSKMFCFVCFESPDDAFRAKEEMNGSTIGTKTVYVGWAQRKTERNQLLKLHLSNCKKKKFFRRHAQAINTKGTNVYILDLDENGLKYYLARFSTAHSGRAATSERWDYITFTSPEEAEQALQIMKGDELQGKMSTCPPCPHYSHISTQSNSFQIFSMPFKF